jgi:hypothetical protein
MHKFAALLRIMLMMMLCIYFISPCFFQVAEPYIQTGDASGIEGCNKVQNALQQQQQGLLQLVPI